MRIQRCCADLVSAESLGGAGGTKQGDSGCMDAAFAHTGYVGQGLREGPPLDLRWSSRWLRAVGATFDISSVRLLAPQQLHSVVLLSQG